MEIKVIWRECRNGLEAVGQLLVYNLEDQTFQKNSEKCAKNRKIAVSFWNIFLTLVSCLFFKTSLSRTSKYLLSFKS